VSKTDAKVVVAVKILNFDVTQIQIGPTLYLLTFLLSLGLKAK